MVENDNDESDEKPMFKIYDNCLPKTLALIFYRSSTFSPSMKRSVRPLFSVLIFIVVAATLGGRVAVRREVGSTYADDNVDGFQEKSLAPLDLPVFNSSLLKLAEIEVGEHKLKQEIEQLLEGNFGSHGRYRTYATWRRFGGVDMRARTSRGFPVNIRSPEFYRIWLEFRRALGDWSRKKRFQPNVMSELVDLVKVPIDKHSGFVFMKRKYSSCAVVGNSGILLNKEYGPLIDSHEAVIRLNNARIEFFHKNVGSKTTISFVNSNILHLCARREDCSCHPYGPSVPIVMYMCQPIQFLDYVLCSSSHKSPLLVTDARFDVLCSRIVKYYSLKRFSDGKNRTLADWSKAHDGDMFHYSSGMQAVMLALGICDKVSLFGFGKSPSARHHYHTNQRAELPLHDYKAEYDFYRDLIENPGSIPFMPKDFESPPVVIFH